MVPAQNLDKTKDPVEMLNVVLERVWRDLCCAYDAISGMPDAKMLFEGADLTKPPRAAVAVIANMLLEVMENIGRFSPWYTKPARSFGLASMRDPVTGNNRWMLAPEAMQKWRLTVDELASAIQQNNGLIQAMILVEDLMEDSAQVEPFVTAYCECSPPRMIHVTQSVLVKAEILCDACLQAFE